MKPLYLLNILLIVSLFYAGAHLNEEEKAVLAGLREGMDAYDWAAAAFTMWGGICAIYSSFVAVKTLAQARFVGGALLLLSVVALLYAIIIIVGTEDMKMQDVLLVFGPYIVLGMWLSFYMLLTGRMDDEAAKFKSAA